MKKNLLILVVIILFGLPLLGMLTGKATFQQSGIAQPGSWVERGTPMMAQTDTSSMEEIMDEHMGLNEPTESKTAATGQVAMMPAPVPPVDSNSGDFTPDVDRTIIKNVSLSLVADDTQVLVDQISNKVKEFNGLVTNSNVYEDEIVYSQKRVGGGVNAYMTLRVPVEKLDQALSEIKALAAKVVSESVSATDETERKVDMQAQLKNLQASEEQLLKIMQSAKTVQETLQVQRELTNVRENIERLQARLDNLEGAAAMSTISISISTKESELPIVNPDKKSLLEEVKVAFKDAVNLYRNLSIAGVRLLILTSPVLIIGGVGYLLLKKRNK